MLGRGPAAAGGHSAAGPRALTLWWVIFNHPDACIANPGAPEQCGYVDVFGQAFLDSVANGTPDPSLIAQNLASELAVLYATGASTMGSGRVRMVASIYKSEPGLNLAGPSVVDLMGFGRAFEDPSAEVHLVVRDHGAVVASDLATQFLNFLEPHCSDPNLGWFAGDNICADAQFAIFAPGESGEEAVYALADPSQPLPSSRIRVMPECPTDPVGQPGGASPVLAPLLSVRPAWWQSGKEVRFIYREEEGGGRGRHGCSGKMGQRTL